MILLQVQFGSTAQCVCVHYAAFVHSCKRAFQVFHAHVLRRVTAIEQQHNVMQQQLNCVNDMWLCITESLRTHCPHGLKLLDRYGSKVLNAELLLTA